MTDTEAGLLRAVLDDPASDLPRLVYADWLEENGQPERGEFVRVQVELVRLERRAADLFNDDTDWGRCGSVSDRWCPNCGDCSCRDPEESLSDKDCPLHDPASPHACLDELERRRDALRRRERELHPQGSREDVAFGELLGVGRSPHPIRWVYRRGFVEHVTAPLAVLFGGRCEACQYWAREATSQLTEGHPDCPDCHGTGHTPGDAPRLFACQPVTRVTPVGVETTGDWTDERDLPGSWNSLPASLHDVMWELFPTARRSSTVLSYLSFGDPPSATAALSVACVALGRRLAGLEVTA